MSAINLIYRAMEEENGLPKLGFTATTLAVRFGKDIGQDAAGMVYRPLFVPGQPNGVSCSPTIQSLPPFALPVSCGGRNRKTAVWSIEESDLGIELVAQEDSRTIAHRHVSIGPARTMTGDEFRDAVWATQPKWKRVSPTGS